MPRPHHDAKDMDPTASFPFEDGEITYIADRREKGDFRR